jgi:hypothetical protein
MAMNAPNVSPKVLVINGSYRKGGIIDKCARGLVVDQNRSSLKQAADLLGARTIGVLFIGLAAREKRQEIGDRTRTRTRKLGNCWFPEEEDHFLLLAFLAGKGR